MSDAALPRVPPWASLGRGRALLAGIWFFAAAGSAAMAAYLWWGNWIGPEGWTMLMSELSQTYLVYLTSIAVVTFSARGPAGRGPVRRSALVIAGGFSAGFNLLVVSALASIALDVRNVEDVVPFIEFLSAFVSPVVAPAIAYFFAGAR